MSSPTPEDQRAVIARIVERHGELRAVETADYAEIFDAHGEKVALTTRPDLILLLNTLAASLPQTGAVGDEEVERAINAYERELRFWNGIERAALGDKIPAMRAALSTISPPRDLERPDDVTAWLVEETWSGFVHYVHISFDAARFLREHQRNKERPPGATARHNERMITKNIDEAMRFPTKEAADAWLKVQPSWMQSDQFQVREHMWPAPASSDLERLRGLSEALAELPETFSGQARASQMIADEAQNGSYSKGRANGEAAAYTHAAQIVSHQLKEPRAALATRPATPGWRCFHCDEAFTDETCAREHFGVYQDCDPICKVGAERYRDLEDQLAVFRNESDAASKEFYALGAKHTQERMRAEEQGYERGLRDARHEEIWRAFLKGQPLPAPGWRGIESAPRDGTPVLTYCAACATPKNSEVMAVNSFGVGAEGWWGRCANGIVMIAPTHWMPRDPHITFSRGPCCPCP